MMPHRSIVAVALLLSVSACSSSVPESSETTSALGEVARLEDGSGCLATAPLSGSLGPLLARVVFAKGAEGVSADLELYQPSTGELVFKVPYEVTPSPNGFTLGYTLYPNGRNQRGFLSKDWNLTTEQGNTRLEPIEPPAELGRAAIPLRCDWTKGSPSLALTAKAEPGTPRRTSALSGVTRVKFHGCTVTRPVGPNGSVLRLRFQKTFARTDYGGAELTVGADVYDKRTGFARDLFEYGSVKIMQSMRGNVCIGRPSPNPHADCDMAEDIGALEHDAQGQVQLVLRTSGGADSGADPAVRSDSALKRLLGGAASVPVDCDIAQ